MTPQKEVKAILKAKKWTAYMLAKHAGVPTSTILRIVEGADAKHSTMEKIRKAARVA